VLQAEAAVLAGQAAELAEEKAKVLAAELDKVAEKGAEVMADWWARGSLWAERVMKTSTDKLHSPARDTPQVLSRACYCVDRVGPRLQKEGTGWVLDRSWTRVLETGRQSPVQMRWVV
jgi:hypothetical protein